VAALYRRCSSPDKGTLYGEVYIPEITDEDKANGSYYIANFSLADLTEEDCAAFIQKQVAGGWEDVGDNMARKEIIFEGVLCELYLQFVQFFNGQGDFSLDAWRI